METVRRILSLDGIYSINDMDVNDNYTVPQEEDDPYMPLSMEKTGENEFSVMHYFTQRMDLMRDPEAVYHIKDWDGEIGTGWIPVEYRQDGFPQTHQRDTDGLSMETVQFLKEWDQRLDSQGFYEMARDGRLELNGETL